LQNQKLRRRGRGKREGDGGRGVVTGGEEVRGRQESPLEQLLEESCAGLRQRYTLSSSDIFLQARTRYPQHHEVRERGRGKEELDKGKNRSSQKRVFKERGGSNLKYNLRRQSLELQGYVKSI